MTRLLLFQSKANHHAKIGHLDVASFGLIKWTSVVHCTRVLNGVLNQEASAKGGTLFGVDLMDLKGRE